jgi:hypothetical protein
MLLNSRQKKVLGSWKSRLRSFLGNSWRSLLLGGLAASLINVVGHILLRDSTLHALEHDKWHSAAAKIKFDGFSAYKSDAVIIGAFMAIFVVAWAIPGFLRVFRSWCAGIVSAVSIVAFIATLLLARRPDHALLIVTCTLLALGIEFATQLWSEINRNALPDVALHEERPGRGVPDKAEWEVSDTPIESWEFDILNRGAVVESLVERVLVSRVPVVALHGEYGDGKSSVLNLTKLTIADRAVVVPFSAWLPGSQQTLATTLFGDIAKACRQKFYIPQLRKRILAYARVLSGSVPHLGALKELLSAESQAGEISSLSKVFRLLPIPVVVLIDEADRMQSDEIFVLLKILRGTTSIQNVRFICAFNRGQFEDQVRKANAVPADFFEKFFPLTINLPPVDSDLLRKLFLARTNAIFSDNWLVRDGDRKEFDESLHRLWDDDLFQIYTNLRKLNLILNDVETAARPIVGEVHPFDLLAVEVIRRSFPEIYPLLWTNSEFLTLDPRGSESKRSYRTEARQKAAAKVFWETMEGAISTSANPKVASALLHWLFPPYHEVAQSDIAWYQRQRLTSRDQVEQQKRICHPDFFPIYFRYSVPETMFSDAERNVFVKAINESIGPEQIRDVFNQTLDGIAPKTPKRYNFLYKLSRSIDLVNETSAPALAHAVALRAADYLYELFGAYGEGARGINIVFEVAEKLSKTTKAQAVLEDAIMCSTDDTFAYRLVKWIKEKDRNEVLRNYENISTEIIRQCFIKRMNARYGSSADPQAIDLQFADHFAFIEWVEYSEQERQNEHAFWRRYIGKSKKRFAQAMNFIYPGGYSYTYDPTEMINKMFPVEEAAALMTSVNDNEALTETETKALDRFSRLLKGEYPGKNGPGIS